MTPSQQTALDALKADCRRAIELADKATPGPWISDEDDEGSFVETPERCITNTGTQEDARFLAHARTFSPSAARRLLTAIEALEATIERLNQDSAGFVMLFVFVEEKLQQILAENPGEAP